MNFYIKSKTFFMSLAILCTGLVVGFAQAQTQKQAPMKHEGVSVVPLVALSEASHYKMPHNRQLHQKISLCSICPLSWAFYLEYEIITEYRSSSFKTLADLF